jgi:hypothetical protein
MTEQLPTGILALSLLLIVAAVVATLRVVRDDRPTLPPGAPRDWRDDALGWNRLQIR